MKSRLLTYVFLIISCLTTVSMAQTVVDIPTGWSEEAVTIAVFNNILEVENGYVRPKEMLTRAEMAYGIVNAFGAVEMADLSGFTDIVPNAEYYDDMAKAVAMGVISGYGNGKLKPEDTISREEMFAVLYNALKLEEGNIGLLTKFNDKDLISSWSKGIVARMVEDGYVSGNAKGNIKAKEDITREEFAQVMKNIISKYYSNSGSYTEIPKGNVIVNAPNVTLKDSTVRGDLIIADGVKNGITLDNVIVIGRVVVRSGNKESVKLINNSKVRYGIVIVKEKEEAPILTPKGEWYKGAVAKDTITKISIVDSYKATGKESQSWYADQDNIGKITCYIKGTELIMVGNGSGKIYANEDSSYMFDHFNALSTVEINILDTSKVTDMSNMFNYCISLTKLDLSNLDTSKVIDMSNMFNHCTAISKLDLSNFNTDNVVNMASMFSGCWNLTNLNISGFNTNKVENMSNMFKKCDKLKNISIGKNFSTTGNGTTECGLSKKLIR